MIPQNFEYSAPSSLGEALGLLSGGNAKVLAGGMSLIPMMKLRLAAPEHLVDLSRVCELKSIREDGGSIRIGAMTTHYEIETSPLLRGKCPLLAEAASHIGDIQVRNMGTIGGSLAHADPAADYPASLIALEASVRIVSQSGERSMPLEQLLVDALVTALEPGELIADFTVPAEAAGTGTAYKKLVQPASGFAIVGAAARVRRNGGKIAFARVGITGAASKAFRASNVEKLIEGTEGSPADVKKAAAAAADGVDANSDLHASAGYRRDMTRVYTARALTEALVRAA